MTSDPYIRWAEESRRHWRRELFFENLATIPRKVFAFLVSAIILGVFLGIAFSVAREVLSFAYGVAPSQMICLPLVDGRREDLQKQ